MFFAVNSSSKYKRRKWNRRQIRFVRFVILLLLFLDTFTNLNSFVGSEKNWGLRPPYSILISRDNLYGTEGSNIDWELKHLIIRSNVAVDAMSMYRYLHSMTWHITHSTCWILQCPSFDMTLGYRLNKNQLV